MEQSLHERFSEAESAFLDALEAGEDEMAAFERDWAALRDDFEAALAEGAVDPTTASYAHIVSYRISEISKSFLKFEADCEELTASLMADLASIPERNQNHNVDSEQETPTARRDVSLAANWISRNYHNPYPSNSVRDDISRRAKWNRKDVDAWFTEARKRIGWNDIRRQFFGNKRAEAVEKATQFFNNPHAPTDAALAQAFIDMESRVRDLYVEPYKPSELAIALDKAYRDNAAPGGRRVATTYSPTTPSRSVSAEPLPLSPISRSVSPVRLSRKRQRPEALTEDDIHSINRQKRLRQGDSVVPLTRQTQLPSPAASQSDFSEKTPEAVAIEVPSSITQPRQSSPIARLPNPKRRRMSHSDTQSRPKYPSAGSRASRLQTVSAPLPSPAHTQGNTSPSTVSVSPGGPDTASSHSVPASSAVSQLTTPVIASHHVQPTLMQEMLSPADIPSFSFDIPGPATCDQPAAAQRVDLTFFDKSHEYQPCVSAFDEDFYNTSALLGTTSQAVPSMGNAHITSLSSLFNNPLDDDQLLGFLPLPFDQDAIAAPLVQPDALPVLTDVDINFSPFFNLDPSAPLEPRIDDDLLFANLLGNIPTLPTPPAEDVDEAKQMAHLEALKKHRNHLQERIQSLERQIAGRLTA